MYYKKEYGYDVNQTYLVYSDESKTKYLGKIIFWNKEGYTVYPVKGEIKSELSWEHALDVFRYLETAYDQVQQILHDEIVPIMQELLNQTQRRLTRHTLTYEGIDLGQPYFGIDTDNFYEFNRGIEDTSWGYTKTHYSRYGKRFPELVEFTKIAKLINYDQEMVAEKTNDRH